MAQKISNFDQVLGKIETLLLLANGNFQKVDSEFSSQYVNVLWKGLKNDGITDNSAAFQKLLNDLPADKVVFFPAGTYRFNKTIEIPKAVRIIGENEKTTILEFNGVSAFNVTNRVDRIRISKMRLVDIQKAKDTIGIKFGSYSSYQVIEDVEIYDFGKWGYEQQGGLFFLLRRLYFKGCGLNASDEMRGSMYFWETTPGSSSTTGILEHVYCRTGGLYGFYGSNMRFISSNNLTVEYHDYAFYGKSIREMYNLNFYEEANREADAVVLDDCAGAVFSTPRTSNPIKRIWTNVALSDRRPLHFDRQDIEARYLKLQELSLTYNKNMTVDEEGRIRYKDNQLEIRDKDSFKPVQKIQTAAPTAPLVGESYFDTVQGLPFWFDGATFKTIQAQSGGGSVVTTGQKADGTSYIKFDNGVLVAFKRFSSVPVDVSVGAMFKSADIVWALPEVFVTTATNVVVNGYATNGGYVSGGNVQNGTTVTLNIYSPINLASSNMHVVAWGRWK